MAIDHFTAHQSELAALMEKLRTQLANAQKAQGEANFAQLALAGVCTSWKVSNPGEGEPAFFLHMANRRVVAQELLTPEELEEARSKGWIVASLRNVEKEPCPQCSTQLPVIEHYMRTYELDGSEVWSKACVVCCPACSITRKVRSIEERSFPF